MEEPFNSHNETTLSQKTFQRENVYDLSSMYPTDTSRKLQSFLCPETSRGSDSSHVSSFHAASSPDAEVTCLTLGGFS